MQIKTKLASGLAAAATLVVTFGIGATAASAGTGTPCLQNSCNGLDPTQSYNQSTGVEWSSGASAVHSVPALGGTHDERWGPTGQTTRGRITPGNTDTYEIW